MAGRMDSVKAQRLAAAGVCPPEGGSAHDHAYPACPTSHARGSYGAQKAQLLRRLRRIEGQVRGLQRMVEEEKYCVDVLNQIAAVKAALDRVGLALLESHTRGCVARALREGDREAERSIRELTEVILRFLREA